VVKGKKKRAEKGMKGPMQKTDGHRKSSKGKKRPQKTCDARKRIASKNGQRGVSKAGPLKSVAKSAR